MTSPQYERLLESTAPGSEDGFEKPLPGVLPKSIRDEKRKSRIIQALAVLNILLAISLCAVGTILWKKQLCLTNTPYSPAWGAVKYVSKRFASEDIFYMEDETSPVLDEAWRNNTGPSNGHIRLPEDEARKNIPSVELPYKPGYYLYGISMYHQIHCLDVIRKTFFPTHYFPNVSDSDVTKHKKHCFDYLRQSIMCSGDVTMDRYFNNSFIEPASSPKKADLARDTNWMDSYSGLYKSMTPQERMRSAPLMWDTVHQCRDYDALWAWVDEFQLVDQAFVDEYGTDREEDA